MLDDLSYITELIRASIQLEHQPNLEQGLRELANMTSRISGTEICSIMLLTDSNGEGGQDPQLRVFAHYGRLPAVAYQEVTKMSQGIAGRVAASGKPLLVRDILKSELAQEARYGRETNKSFISAPIKIGDKVIGVINVSSPKNGRCLNEDDLELLKIFALFVGKSIQVVQLQNMLESKFLQMSAVRAAEAEGMPTKRTGQLSPDPAQLAKIVAKTVFRELTDANFGPNQIISVATEVLDLLHKNLAKHEQRIVRELGSATDTRTDRNHSQGERPIAIDKHYGVPPENS
jgi:L-methionine (R)-S-oxide reductase